MKLFRKLFRGYAVALATAVILSVSAHASAQKGSVRAIHDGAAEISSDSGKTWRKANVGASVSAHSMIRTDATATVDVFLGDNGPVVRVTKGTTLGFDKLDAEDTGVEKVIETQLDLKNGRILGNVKKMAAASKYEVKTPNGVAGIRGTEYSISADGVVHVVSGTVVVVYIIDNVPLPPVTLTAGMQSSPPANATLAVPVVGNQVVDGDFAQLVEIAGTTNPPPPPPPTTVPGPTIPNTIDSTNSPLSEDQPGSGTTGGTSNNNNNNVG